MKIVRCESHVVAVPAPFIGGRYWIFVEIETDCGIKGVGEIYAATFHPSVMQSAITDVYQRFLQGQDPHHIENFFRQAYSSGFTQRPDLTMMGIVSGLEMACWDIIGKAAKQPVYQLLGGKIHDRLRCYTYIYPKNKQGDYDYDNLELTVNTAIEMMEKGFTALKFDPTGPYTAYDGHQLSLNDIEKSVTFCQRIREAVGNNCDLLFGTHGQMTPAAAIRLAKKLEPFDPLWFEEPVPPGNAAAMAQVARQTSIPIATGERLTTKYEFQDLISHKAAAILQMNLGRVGGILEAKKIAAIAEANYLQIAPHLYNGPVGAAASIQLATATPNFLIQESILDWSGFHAQVLQEKIQWQNGYIIPSTKPGLGIELDMDVIKGHSPYKERALHLSMAPAPYDVKQQSDKTWLAKQDA